jgi:hypothetical protein
MLRAKTIRSDNYSKQSKSIIRSRKIVTERYRGNAKMLKVPAIHITNVHWAN